MNRHKRGKRINQAQYPPAWKRRLWFVERRGWKFNHVCVPCRLSRRGGGLCIKCKKPTMDIRHMGVPRKQDSWWTKPETWEQWYQHMRVNGKYHNWENENE